MFAADLQLAKEAETVGARRERKARERSSRTASIDTSTISSKSSVSTERELWWSAGLKKAKNIKPRILRPSTSRSTSSHKTTPNTMPKKLDLRLARDFKDPALQPSYTYSSTLSPTLPSGDSLHLQDYEVPELEGDVSSRRTESTRSRFSSKCLALSLSLLCTDRFDRRSTVGSEDTQYSGGQRRCDPTPAHKSWVFRNEQD
jgi:hypothetical protein